MERRTDGREREMGMEGIGEGREEKENGDRPSTVFGLKVVLTTIVVSATCPPRFIDGVGHYETQVCQRENW